MFRSLRRDPAFTAIAVLSLGLALGLVTAVFAVVDAVRHPQSAFRQPERMFAIYGRGDGAAGDVTNVERLEALDGRLHSVQGVAYVGWYYNGLAQAGTRSRTIMARAVSSNYFALGGVRPFLGRLFTDATIDEDADRSAVISHRLWRSLYQSEPRLERLSITLGSRTLQIVGVIPPVVGNESFSDVYVALPRAALASATGSRGVVPMVRLRDGASYATLVGELRSVSDYLTAVHGTGKWPFHFVPLSAKPDVLELQQIHWVLIAAALSVLFIACTNLANLVLARGLVRQRDMAVRLSMGARRVDLVIGILKECAALALVGAVIGVLVGVWGMELLHARMTSRVPYLGNLDPLFSWRVVAASAVAALASAALFGIWPALRLSDLRVSEHLKENAGTTTGRSRGRYSALVIGQVALALSLLTGAGLLVRAAAEVRGFDFGFDPRPILSVRVNRDARGDTRPGAATDFYAQLQHRLETLPHAQALVWMSLAPADSEVVTAELAEGRTRWSARRDGYWVVSPSLLRTLGVAVTSGRDFDASDALGEGAAIVDESVARRLWRGDDPVGRMIKLGTARSPQPWLRVIGVAHRARFWMPTEAYDPDDDPGNIYVVSAATPRAREFLLRAGAGEQAAMALEIDRMLRDMLGPRPSFLISRWSDRYAELLRTQQFLSRLFLGFGAVALFLCALGLYSVLSYAVSRRQREYGIRLAIGAGRRDLFRVVLRDGAVLVLAGTALGAFTSMWTNTLIDRYTLNVYHIDALTLVVAELALVMVALAACVVPAVRATRANPVDVLRAV